MYIVAARAGKDVDIHAFGLETRMLRLLLAVAAITGRCLMIAVVDRIQCGMYGVTGRALDQRAIVRTAKEADGLTHDSINFMTLETREQLFVARRLIGATAKLRQWRKAPAAMSPGYMDASRTVTGLAIVVDSRCAGILQVEMRAILHRPHLGPRMTAQAGLRPLFAVAGCAFGLGWIRTILALSASRRERYK